MSIFRRLLAYGQAVLKWDGPVEAVSDRRKQESIPTSVIVRSVMAMNFCQLGSLNSLGQTRSHPLWAKWLKRGLPSADTIGRVATLVNVEEVRQFCHHVYERLKRGKALPPPVHGLIAAVVDGHEMHASYKRHCPGCLERVVHTARGDRIQYYHRYVAVSLVTEPICLLLDLEPMRPGEDEVATALRLLDRVVQEYPRAFDLVQGDALYADSRFFNWAIDHGKYALAVLKDERRDLFEDARRLFEDGKPSVTRDANVRRECWDLEGFRTWPQVKEPVRVVRSRETRTMRRQLDKQLCEQTSDWYWVATLPQCCASTGAVVRLGHARWDIENQGFNELTTWWHADHVYRHEPTAMLVFLLLAFLCLNVFRAFYWRNLKPAARMAVSVLHVARKVQAELYHLTCRAPP